MGRSRKLNLADLRCFNSIATFGSLSAAARHLKQPKSTVSRSLARLETELGAPLVERSNRQLRLTDAGILFRPHASHLLVLAEEAESVVRGADNIARGCLTVNATYAFSETIIAPMLPPLLAKYPEMQIALDIESRAVDPMSVAADLAIRLGPLEDSSLIAKRLAALEVWFCASPDYLAAKGNPTKAEDLQLHDTVARENQRDAWTVRDRDGGSIEVPLRPRVVVTEPAATLAAVCAGAGVGRIPDYLAAPAIAQGRLVRLLPDAAPYRVDVHALYSAHQATSRKLRVFIDALAAHLAAFRVRAERATAGR